MRSRRLRTAAPRGDPHRKRKSSIPWNEVPFVNQERCRLCKKCHNCPSGVCVAEKACSACREQCRVPRRLFQAISGNKTLYHECGPGSKCEKFSVISTSSGRAYHCNHTGRIFQHKCKMEPIRVRNKDACHLAFENNCHRYHNCADGACEFEDKHKPCECVVWCKKKTSSAYQCTECKALHTCTPETCRHVVDFEEGVTGCALTGLILQSAPTSIASVARAKEGKGVQIDSHSAKTTRNVPTGANYNEPSEMKVIDEYTIFCKAVRAAAKSFANPERNGNRAFYSIYANFRRFRAVTPFAKKCDRWLAQVLPLDHKRWVSEDWQLSVRLTAECYYNILPKGYEMKFFAKCTDDPEVALASMSLAILLVMGHGLSSQGSLLVAPIPVLHHDNLRTTASFLKGSRLVNSNKYATSNYITLASIIAQLLDVKFQMYLEIYELRTDELSMTPEELQSQNTKTFQEWIALPRKRIPGRTRASLADHIYYHSAHHEFKITRSPEDRPIMETRQGEVVRTGTYEPLSRAAVDWKRVCESNKLGVPLRRPVPGTRITIQYAWQHVVAGHILMLGEEDGNYRLLSPCYVDIDDALHYAMRLCNSFLRLR